MNARYILLSLVVAVSCIVSAADTRHTPKRGSVERLAICDGARAYVIKDYVSQKKLPQPLVFKIDRIEVTGDYCSFQAIPLFRDGSNVGTDYLMDISFNFCLKRANGTWRVIYDLSSTDVPSEAELRRMWRVFPKEFPFVLLPKFWRDHFNRIK